jgi:hypothetical protein
MNIFCKTREMSMNISTITSICQLAVNSDFVYMIRSLVHTMQSLICTMFLVKGKRDNDDDNEDKAAGDATCTHFKSCK